LSHIARDIDESGIAGDMEFVYDLPEDCHIKGNVNLMTSALMNLIKNAINYSKGTEMGVFMLTKNQRFYTFVFYDNGVGVAPEHIPHLFERFYRVDKGRSRKVGGTGLGLPIVRTAFNTMGGSVTVRNRQGGGLEFVFTIPIWYPKKETPDVPELTSQDESYDSLEDKE
jgi:two-component system OmpR family sensor kinase